MKQLDNTTIFFYGLPAISIAFLGLPLYIYLPTFYADSVGLSVGLVGGILLLTRLLDMFLDPFLGRMSDMLGKRKGLIALGAVMMLVGFWALIHPPMTLIPFWLFSFSFVAYVGWSLMNIPYLALNAELSPHYEDTTKLAFSREVLGIIGVVIALSLPYLFDVAGDPAKSLQLFFYGVCVSLVIGVTVFWEKIKEERLTWSLLPMKQALVTFWKEFSSAWKLFAAFIINNLANAFPATLFLFYVEWVLDAKAYTGILLLIYFLSGVVALPLWLYIARKQSKKKAWIISMILASSVFLYVPFLGHGDVIWFGLISIISGMSLGADMALPAAMQSDVAQKTRSTGNHLGGVLFGLWAMLTKLAFALAVGIAFGVLGWVGFNTQNPTETSLHVMAYLYAWVPVALKCCAVYFAASFKEMMN